MDRAVKRDCVRWTGPMTCGESRAEIWRIYVWTEQSNEIEFVGQE